jgi:hypothetical protein
LSGLYHIKNPLTGVFCNMGAVVENT